MLQIQVLEVIYCNWEYFMRTYTTMFGILYANSDELWSIVHVKKNAIWKNLT